MILNEESSIPNVEPRDSVSFTANGSFSLFSGDFISASTPTRERSASYLELSSPYNETSLLSNTSLQRMRCLSQSINDLKILREKQQERKHEMGDLLNDDFLREHARKLKDARDKIKILEAKYQNPRKVGTKIDVSSLDRKKNLGLAEKDETDTGQQSSLEGHNAT